MRPETDIKGNKVLFALWLSDAAGCPTSGKRRHFARASNIAEIRHIHTPKWHCLHNSLVNFLADDVAGILWDSGR